MKALVFPRLLGLLLLSVFFLGWSLPPTSAAAPGGGQTDAGPPPVRLGAVTFTPAKGEAPSLPPGLMVKEYAPDQRGYYLVQFRGPITEAWKREVEAQGAELLGYLPEFTFKARMTPGEARKVAQLPQVLWVGLFHPAYKLSPHLKREGLNLYTVRLERGADGAQVRAAIRAAGVELLRHHGPFLTVAADAAQVEAIARILDVAVIENFKFPERHNDYGGGVIMGANQAHEAGYDGTGQIVAVADTGLGGGTAASAHRDLPASRIAAIYNWVGTSEFGFYTVIDDGARDVDSGHGTHVALSILGGGDELGRGRGVAPGAALVFQAQENWVVWSPLFKMLGYKDGYLLVGLPADLRELYQQAYAAGARVHSNSWGISGQGGVSDQNAVNTDDFMWNHPDLLILFSAGNEGPNPTTVAPPSTSKNCLSIGASENDREDGYPSDTTYYPPNTMFTYGQGWPDIFPTEPLKSDPVAGNKEQMAGFSSRGPTLDGRIKPDLVAPGTLILSGYSDLFQQYYDTAPNPQNNVWQYDGWLNPMNQYYKYMGGTSMACPLAAGAAAVVREFYQEHYGLAQPSAALIKATLINAAEDLLDENNDGVNDNFYPIPNPHEGWGRVNVARATDGKQQFVEETTGLATGGQQTYTFNVASGATLRITLAWTDNPQENTAAYELVNDLDLEVTAPGGTQYKGNVFSGGWSMPGGTADRRNNVECVYVNNAPGGAWSVKVAAYQVPEGKSPGGTQPFALVVRQEGGTPPVNQPPVAAFSATPTTGPAPLTVNFDASASYDPDGSIVSYGWSFGDGTTGSGKTISHTYTSAGTYTATLVVRDNLNAASAPASQVITVTPADTTLHVGDLDASTKTGRNNWTATVTVLVHNGSHQPVSGATVSGIWRYGTKSKTVSGLTNASGIFTSSLTVSKSLGSATFTVTSLSKSGLTYASLGNHDPDGDSNGTSITVSKP